MLQREIDSPIGRLLLGEQEGWLCEIRLVQPGISCNDSSLVLDEAQRQIGQYFAGERREFDLPLKPQGSAFDRELWREMMKIPFGEIRTYGQLAAAMGRHGAARAVGGACSRNPLLIVAPCHRVVAGTGKLTGFAAGMQAKKTLLSLEGWQIRGDRITEK